MTQVELARGVEEVKEASEGDARLWSVTSIIGVLDKPALIYWSAEETAKCAVNQARAWRGILEESGEDEAIKWLTGARFRTPRGQRTAADLGSAFHAAAEEYVLTGIRPDVDSEVAPFLDQFDGWLQKFQPSFEAAEVTVFSPTYGVAGTCDGFCTIDGVRFIYDFKTTRKSFDKKGTPTSPYPESAALQLAAYRHAELAAVWRARRVSARFVKRYYLLSAEEQELAVPVPEVDTGLVIHVTPEHCEAYPMRCDEPVYESFLFALEAHRWVEQTSKGVMGAPLQPGVTP